MNSTIPERLHPAADPAARDGATTPHVLLLLLRRVDPAYRDVTLFADDVDFSGPIPSELVAYLDIERGTVTFGFDGDALDPALDPRRPRTPRADAVEFIRALGRTREAAREAVRKIAGSSAERGALLGRLDAGASGYVPFAQLGHASGAPLKVESLGARDEALFVALLAGRLPPHLDVAASYEAVVHATLAHLGAAPRTIADLAQLAETCQQTPSSLLRMVDRVTARLRRGGVRVPATAAETKGAAALAEGVLDRVVREYALRD